MVNAFQQFVVALFLNQVKPKYGKKQINSLLENRKIKVPLDKYFIQKLFDTMIHEIMGITVAF